MAWLKTARTTSGATSVQIFEYTGGRQRLVQHLGSAHDETELAVLTTRGRALIAGRGQGELDLGISALTSGTSLAATRPDGALFSSTMPTGQQRLVGSPVVVGTTATALWEALAGVYSTLGFDQVGGAAFRDLVLARIVEPGSIIDTGRVLRGLGRIPPSDSTLRRTLRRCVDGSYRDQLADLCFTYAKASGDISLVLYDVTTLHTEAAKEDDDGLRKIGYSKERRVDPQVVVGLLVDRAGFPLEVGCFEGNQAETLTVVPIIKAFKSRHNIEDMVVAADAGMLSAKNLRELDEAGFRFIVGSRATKAPIDLASHFHWNGSHFTDGQLIDTVTPKTGRNRDNDPDARAEPTWNPSEHSSSWRAVWAFSTKRYAHDNKTINAQEVRAQAVVAGAKTARSPRFVKTSATGRELDETSIKRARAVAGLKGYVTNIPATIMAPSEVVAHYHDLWHVEQSFRFTKHDLAARPFFVRRADAIQAHITVVFAALAVARTAYAKTGIQPKRLVRILGDLRSATIEMNGATHTIPPKIPPETAEIIAQLTD